MKPVIVAACQSVLQDPTSGHSIISVFDQLGIAVPNDAEVPQNAVMPREWTVFSRWTLDEDEEGKNYSNAIEIIWPDGALFNRSVLRATSPSVRAVTFIAKYAGFPMGQNGKLIIRVSIEENEKTVCGPVEIDVLVNLSRVEGL